ncbi:hypothetical protein AB6F89_07265 [Providencia hangzhouensis]|uniref:Carrier domain-containing protein n=1 Tax=Providencia rettgeri TaxID=587 RepID=A0AAW6UH71_PRORE|nr:hypothetical protein [Providencia rettgeri]MBG5891592.1 hypothetical protein [Providencia rettgeri]MDI9094504.1 hypothetical protein [Providencia rettgeri]MDT2037137.1 hypothetical protein [Providencia rettgeri]
MKIELSLLEEAIVAIFKEMKVQGMDNIDLDADFYWNVPSESIYDIYNETTQLDIGQLEADYEMLCKAKENELLIKYNLKNISGILRYLSEKHAK